MRLFGICAGTALGSVLTAWFFAALLIAAGVML